MKKYDVAMHKSKRATVVVLAVPPCSLLHQHHQTVHAAAAENEERELSGNVRASEGERERERGKE